MIDKKKKKKKKKEKKRKRKKKDTCPIVDFAIPVDYRVKIKENKEIQVLRPCQRTKKVMEHESDSGTNSNWCARNDPERLDKWAGRIGNRRTSRDHANNSTIEIGQNTEQSSGDLRRLAVILIPLKDYQLSMVWKEWTREQKN